MYEFLEGRVDALGPGTLVLETGGVGWLLHVPTRGLGGVSVGERCRVLVHLSVSDSALTLFGFLSAAERSLFRRLLQVGGVGPSMALNVLSALDPPALGRAVLDGDVKRLTAVKGVGRKTAERLVLELRDGLEREASEGEAPPAPGAAAIAPGDDLVRVLVELGQPEAAARDAAARARRSHGADADFQQLLRHALQETT